ncbi:MAG: DUF4783 domain-containing protein [Bacteroidales bacterium]|jgi:hypothetical protein|nr:DUF4783 domain-containing protein [Bacteroidales bacterium]
MIFKKILVISSLCIVVSLRGAVHETKAYAPKLPNEIVQALKCCDAKTISKYFNSSVELIFSESQGVYGKSQAEQILKTFFNNNASANGKFNYNELHASDKDNTQYFIGELHGKVLYRVYIYMKDQRIHQMRIESND